MLSEDTTFDDAAGWHLPAPVGDVAGEVAGDAGGR